MDPRTSLDTECRKTSTPSNTQALELPVDQGIFKGNGKEGELGKIGVKRWRIQLEKRGTWRDISSSARVLHEL